MNPHTKRENITKLILAVRNHKNSGYTLAEIIVAIVMLGIMSALIAPQFNLSDPTADSVGQFKGILQQARSRAISTTSAVRVRIDPSQPDNRFTIERANTGGCDFFTRLSADVPLPAPNQADIPVNSTDGFAPSNLVSVGSTSGLEILSIPGGGGVLTLNSPLLTSQTAGSIVALDNNWQADGGLTNKDRTLSETALVSSAVNNWTVCFSSRGIATIYDGNLAEQNSLTLDISNTVNANTDSVTVLKGGAIQ